MQSLAKSIGIQPYPQEGPGGWNKYVVEYLAHFHKLANIFAKMGYKVADVKKAHQEYSWTGKGACAVLCIHLCIPTHPLHHLHASHFLKLIIPLHLYERYPQGDKAATAQLHSRAVGQ